MPPGATGPFEEMEDAFNSGWSDFGVPGTERVAGKVTPAQVFERREKHETVSDHRSHRIGLGLQTPGSMR